MFIINHQQPRNVLLSCLYHFYILCQKCLCCHVFPLLCCVVFSLSLQLWINQNVCTIFDVPALLYYYLHESALTVQTTRLNIARSIQPIYLQTLLSSLDSVFSRMITTYSIHLIQDLVVPLLIPKTRIWQISFNWFIDFSGSFGEYCWVLDLTQEANLNLEQANSFNLGS